MYSGFIVIYCRSLKGLWEMKFSINYMVASVVLEKMEKLKQRISGNIPVSVFVSHAKPNINCIFEARVMHLNR